MIPTSKRKQNEAREQKKINRIFKFMDDSDAIINMCVCGSSFFGFHWFSFLLDGPTSIRSGSPFDSSAAASHANGCCFSVRPSRLGTRNCSYDGPAIHFVSVAHFVAATENGFRIVQTVGTDYRTI